ncbi:MAG: hypothetical protein H8D23_28425 [Candidatus Brocadiales bacterium]|nr:hypothetical protein [Candidatus Brocadiales bacterium]
MTEKKSNKWYLAKDEPIKNGGFRKGAEIGGRDDLNGLLKDKSIAVGTILVRNNIFYIVESSRGNSEYKRSRLDRINAFLHNEHTPISIQVKNNITSLIIHGKSYQVKTDELINKIKLLQELKN